MKFILVTNNSLVHEKFRVESNKNLQEVIFKPDEEFIDILKRVRDMIHEGYTLLTHPLTGSVKPYETPYKSIAVSAEKSRLDLDSLQIIEDAIVITQKFLNDYEKRDFSERVYNDFRLIDYNLIASGVESITQFC